MLTIEKSAADPLVFENVYTYSYFNISLAGLGAPVTGVYSFARRDGRQYENIGSFGFAVRRGGVS